MRLLSKQKTEKSKVIVDGHQQVTDAIFAKLRLLEQRIAGIEQIVSTTRRDVSRIDKKVYREVTAAPIEEKKPAVSIWDEVAK